MKRKAIGQAEESRLRQYPWFVPYAFILPFMVLFIPFGIGSTLGAFGISLFDWHLGRVTGLAGMANYVEVATDPLFQHSLVVTFKLFISFLVIVLPIAMFIAVVMDGVRSRAERVLQLVLFLPITMSLVSVAMIFALLYDDRIGLLTEIAKALGLGVPGFLTNPATAPWSIVLLRIWRVVGFYAIILYGGLKSIPQDLYDASTTDGANAWQTFWHITMPLMRPVTLFVCVSATIAAWELFAEPNILTQGGPARSTYTAIMYIYNAAFQSFELGIGAAAATVLAVLIIGSILLMMRLLRPKY